MSNFLQRKVGRLSALVIVGLLLVGGGSGVIPFGTTTAARSAFANGNTYLGKVVLTTNNFTSLANGSAWQSVAVDTTGAKDVHFEIQSKGQASGTTFVDFYVSETMSDGTVYTDGATGTEGTFTAANRFNSRYLGSVKYNANTAAVQGTLKLSDVFKVIPKKFSIIAINNSGAAVSATAGDHVFHYELVF